MIRFNYAADGRAIAEEVGIPYNPFTDMVVARVEQDVLYGGVIYQGYTGASIIMHMAGFHPNWINRDMLWVCFHYPFEQLGVRKVFGQVGLHNERALEINTKLGFKQEALIKDVYPEGDMCLLSVYKADCKWLRLTPRTMKDTSNGQEK